MKTLTLIFTLSFSILMFSSPSYAGWTKLVTNVDGTTFYVDFERIRKHGEYVYWWTLVDYLKPMEGDLSAKRYWEGDCKLFRLRYLSGSYHKEPMGGGTAEPSTYSGDDWKYPSPNSAMEFLLKKVCSR